TYLGGNLTVSGTTNLQNISLTNASTTNLTVSGTAWINNGVITNASTTYATLPTFWGTNGTVTEFNFTNATGTRLSITNATTTTFRSDGLATFGGNVGIGTTNPSAKLQISGGDILIDNNQNIQGKNTVGTALNIYGSLDAANNLAVGKSSFGGHLYLSAGGPAKNVTITQDAGTITTATFGDSIILSPDGTEVMRLLSTGNVGIGTTTPNNLLTLTATTSPAIGFTLRTGGTGADGVSGWTMGIDTADANKFKIASSTAVGTNARLTIDGNGNVGIGTTGPGQLLDVVGGNIRIASAQKYFLSAANTLALGTGAGAGGVGLWSGTNGATLDWDISTGIILQASQPSMIFRNGGATGFIWQDNNSVERMRLTNAGNLGIGTTTPGAKLEIVNNSGATTTDQLFLTNFTSSTTTAARLSFRAADISGVGTTTSAITSILQQNWTTGKGDLAFSTLRSGSLTEAMRINDLGYLGIGTSTPTHPLHIFTTDDAVKIESTSVTGYTQVLFKGTGRQYQIGVGNASETFFGVANKLFIFDQGAGSGTMRLVMDTSGNVGIGTTTPDMKLSVVGTGNVDIRIESSATVDASAVVRYKRNTTGETREWWTGTGSQANDNFDIYDNTASALRLTINSSGNVGIGTSTPGSLLSVHSTGNTYLGGNLTVSGTTNLQNISLTNASTTNLTVSGTAWINNGVITNASTT
ncbi:MAG: hypothetical protein Q7J73_05315, partial [Dehalococcoidales bacterium]|nr:hypothetical protein [Dehalococcoidales bacterium]